MTLVYLLSGHSWAVLLVILYKCGGHTDSSQDYVKPKCHSWFKSVCSLTKHETKDKKGRVVKNNQRICPRGGGVCFASSIQSTQIAWHGQTKKKISVEELEPWSDDYKNAKSSACRQITNTAATSWGVSGDDAIYSHMYYTAPGFEILMIFNDILWWFMFHAVQYYKVGIFLKSSRQRFGMNFRGRLNGFVWFPFISMRTDDLRGVFWVKSEAMGLIQLLSQRSTVLVNLNCNLVDTGQISPQTLKRHKLMTFLNMFIFFYFLFFKWIQIHGARKTYRIILFPLNVKTGHNRHER